ncbi:phosphohistidine phosphatase [Winogradskyella wandonensis]|uniref:Phosphohistidine phosphatase n=1 Tax=Winogradskyella wandonensis TaxID=1442586 RepID=A0A4R1KV99_9FLAO|nr:histidine phosphatase family protein [Winogradskyella wandonensis]TCK69098.1 phosphohistidine phosphatase [Winogradskyella wandonensis]
MKRLILVRHAKSSWKYNVSDKERPLKQRGVDDALLISKEFSGKGIIVDAVYTSPAKRAHTTCTIFKQNLNWPSSKIEIVDDLYDFGGESVIRYINNLSDSLNTVAIFGHNHAFTTIANQMGDKYIDNLPTAGLVLIKFNVDSWKYAKYGQTELIMFPRDFRP